MRKRMREAWLPPAMFVWMTVALVVTMTTGLVPGLLICGGYFIVDEWGL